MALPENGKKISAWNAGTVDQNSYFVQAKNGATEKVSADEVADYVGTSATFSGLTTTAKTPIGAINEVRGTILSSTLTTGSTSLTFNDASILADSMLAVYTSPEIFYNTLTASVGSVVLTFDAQAADVGVKLEVR